MQAKTKNVNELANALRLKEMEQKREWGNGLAGARVNGKR